MHTKTLSAFSKREYTKAFLFLATHVASMMGRKFEEGDWAHVYCNAKEIPVAPWSNLSIDVMYGNIGVEQKMICRKSDRALLDACGTSIMHPAGTRAIRIPSEEDPTKAARIVLQQYIELIDSRANIVNILNRYHHEIISYNEAYDALRATRMGSSSVKLSLPKQLTPTGLPDAAPDMRTGWLLWKDTLNEFLYFEEPMTKPNPKEFVAEWRESGGGRRKASRNLWVYHKETGEKRYSITTDAGAKIQPYFTVPLPTDPCLYHFVVQGYDCGNGLIRVWLTRVTANLLQQSLGNLEPDAIAAAVESVNIEQLHESDNKGTFGPTAVEVMVPYASYEKLKTLFQGVSDEHNFRLLVESLRDP